MKNKKNWLVLALVLSFSGLTMAGSLPSESSISKIPARDKTQNNSLSIDEFNQVLGTLRGVFNWYKNDQLQIGINDNTPDEDLTLDVGGKIGAEYFCDERGQNCIKAGEWAVQDPNGVTARPTTPTPSAKKNEAADCMVRYRVKAGSWVSEWQETKGNQIPEGDWALFNDTEKEVCADRGCGIQIGMKCEKAAQDISPTSCQARYRIFDPNNTATDSGWIITPKSEENSWQDGEWLAVDSWNNLWWQTGVQCQSENTTCRLSFKTRDEKFTSDWSSSANTQNKIWADGAAQHLESNRIRPCDGKNGCGVKLRLHCALKDSVPKIPIYQCPSEKFGSCTSNCNGQLSAEAVCTFTKNSGNENCNQTENRNCTPLGHLVR